MKFNHKNKLLVLLVGLLLSAAASAQQPTSAVMTAMAANAKQLKHYTYKQRTETYHKGELKNARVEEIHFNPSGERVSIPLKQENAEPETYHRGPGARLIAKKVAEKKEEMKEYAERLMSLASRYLAADPAKLQAALTNAEVTTGGTSNQTRITLRDFVKSGDSMVMMFDPVTHRPTKTRVFTSLDDDSVSITLAFDQIGEGPDYPGKTVVSADAKQLEIRLYTYAYHL